jgi:EmrB/QacA subfamily drug resistance transporter
MTQRTRVLSVVSAAVFMASLDLFIVNIAFPDIQRDFGGAGDASLSWVLNAYAIVFAALLVPAGRLADRIGRKRVFLAGVAVFCLASAVCAVAPSVGVLVAARALQAIGGAALMPTSLALLLAEFPAERRAGAVAAWAAVGGVAAAAGPPIGGLLVGASWHWIFIVNLPVGLATVVLGARVLHETRDEARGPMPDVLGAIVLAGGVAALTAAIVQGPEWGWGSGRVVGLAVGALALLALFVRRSATHVAPVVELALLRNRTFAAATVSALLFYAAFAANLLGSVLFLTRVWDERVLTAGLMIAPGPLMAAVFAVISGKLAPRFGQRALAATGTTLFALGGIWCMTHVGTTPHYATDFLPGWLIGGVGVGLTIAPLSSAAASSLSPARFATGTGVFTMARQLGSAIGVAVFVAVLGSPAPGHAVAAFQHSWAVMAGASLAGGLAALAMPRPVRAARAGELAVAEAVSSG